MLNVLRQQARQARIPICRQYATAYVPPASLEDVEAPRFRHPPRTKPTSPSFYTARATYFDRLNTLEDAILTTRKVLRSLQLLPLPKFARDAIPPIQPVWKTKDSLAQYLSTRLTTSRYRRFITLLGQLDEYRRIADIAGCYELASRVQDILKLFERENKDAVLARGKRKPVKFDEYGRSYTIGRRKESTARVWVIPVQSPLSASPSTSLFAQNLPPAATISETGPTSDLTPSGPLSLASAPAPPVTVTTTNILINNAPLAQYFPLPSDRERVIRPFKIAGLIGAFNVFAIVRGGGTTGQSGAVTLGIAKALAAHVPEVEVLLRKAKLMRRDPRMVERKKTGMMKARRAYTWVKR